MSNKTQSAAILLLLLGAALLFYQLDALSYSVDEFLNVETDRLNYPSIVATILNGSDLHPPLTHWISHSWLLLFGANEWSMRAIWAFAGVLILALTYRFGKTLGSKTAGLLGTALLATLSTFLLYTRFVKYYAFAMLMALALMLIFFILYKRGKTRHLAIYTITLTLFLYGDYFGPACCVIWQDLLLLAECLRQRSRSRWLFFAKVLGAQFLAGLLWLPWLSGAFFQARRVFNLTPATISGSFLSFLLKMIHAIYAFSLGETLFPWHPIALLGSLSVFGMLIVSMLSLVQNPTRLTLWTGTFTSLTLISMGLLNSTLIKGVPFISFAKHIIFILPFFLLWLSSGLETLSNKAISWLLIGGLFVAHIFGLAHYFNGEQFHNPIYAVPTREIVNRVIQASDTDDVIVASKDIGVRFYAETLSEKPTNVIDPSRAETLIQKRQPERVWYFVFGRDRTQKSITSELRQWLDTHYERVEVQGYVKTPPLYRRLKTWLYNRPAYPYKLTVYVYRRPGHGF